MNYTTINNNLKNYKKYIDKQISVLDDKANVQSFGNEDTFSKTMNKLTLLQNSSEFLEEVINSLNEILEK